MAPKVKGEASQPGGDVVGTRKRDACLAEIAAATGQSKKLGVGRRNYLELMTRATAEATAKAIKTPGVIPRAAEAVANEFLIVRVGDRFMASDARAIPDPQACRCGVSVAYPGVGEVGEVGEIIVSAHAAEVLSHTPIEEMRQRARLLYEQHREEIEAAFAQIRHLDDVLGSIV